MANCFVYPPPQKGGGWILTVDFQWFLVCLLLFCILFIILEALSTLGSAERKLKDFSQEHHAHIVTFMQKYVHA